MHSCQLELKSDCLQQVSRVTLLQPHSFVQFLQCLRTSHTVIDFWQSILLVGLRVIEDIPTHENWVEIWHVKHCISLTFLHLLLRFLIWLLLLLLLKECLFWIVLLVLLHLMFIFDAIKILAFRLHSFSEL